VTVRPLDPAVIATDRGADRPTSFEDILDLLDALHPAWHADAACRGQTDVMFPVAEHGHRLDTYTARALCARCPVQAPCAEQGRTERYGVWGGSSIGRVRQRERSAAIRDALADGEWHSTSDIAQHLKNHLSTVHRSLVGLVSAGVLERQKRHPSTYYRLKETT
jgi:DNA-binding transcriptional ArsR family regulator